MTKASVGTIEGTVAGWSKHADKVIVYAYEKGSFDVDAETQGSGDGNLQFKNAITSVQANANGNFELHFLEAGDYELYFAGYDDDDQDGQFEWKGKRSFDILAGIDLNVILVEADRSTRLELTIISILPLYHKVKVIIYHNHYEM